MKQIIVNIIIGAIVLAVIKAHSVELSIVAGSPHQEYDFVKEVLVERLKLQDSSQSSVSDHTSRIFYFAQRNGVNSIISIEVLTRTGSGSYEQVIEGMRFAANRSKIILNALGPLTNNWCQVMASYPRVVFITPVNSDGKIIDASKFPDCRAANILVVAGLDASLTDLHSTQDRGDIVRLAVPFVNIKSPIGSASSRAYGMGMVAGNMAQLIRTNPELEGAELVNSFLKTNTIYLEKLEGKVKAGRAFVVLE